jgi:hypothetical protein
MLHHYCKTEDNKMEEIRQEMRRMTRLLEALRPETPVRTWAETVAAMPPHVREMRASLLGSTVASSTRADYEAKFKRVEKDVGQAIDYNALLLYAFQNKNKAASTMKQMKSACAFVLRSRGTPLTQCEDEDLNRVYDGLFDRATPLAKPRQWRGEISGNRLDQLCEFLTKRGEVGKELALACSVMYDCTLRPRDVKQLSPLHVVTARENDEPLYVMSVRKATVKSQDKLGKYEAHPIMAKEAVPILEEMGATNSRERLFPNWNRRVVNRLIKECATLHGWSPMYQWCAHGIRHGAATRELKELWDLIGKRCGAWRGRVAEDYAGLGHGHPLNYEAREAIRTGNAVGQKRKRETR